MSSSESYGSDVTTISSWPFGGYRLPLKVRSEVIGLFSGGPLEDEAQGTPAAWCPVPPYITRCCVLPPVRSNKEDIIEPPVNLPGRGYELLCIIALVGMVLTAERGSPGPVRSGPCSSLPRGGPYLRTDGFRGTSQTNHHFAGHHCSSREINSFGRGREREMRRGSAH